MNSQMMENILSQHAEEAAFLWLLRNAAVAEPHYSLSDLAELDERVEAHIDGLRIAGDAGWEICKEVLAWEEPGELFTAAVLAFECGAEARIQAVLEAGVEDLELSRGIISALGWMPYPQAEKYIKKLLGAEAPHLRRIGIATSAIHRRDPGQSLADAISQSDPWLRARVLRAVGELGRLNLLPAIKLYLTDENEDCRFQAAWSASLLMDNEALNILRSFLGPRSPYAEKALKLALRRLGLSLAHSWQKELAQNQQNIRLALMGAGIIGDPALVPWVIEQMNIPELARIAGEAFSMISGVDIAYYDLEGPCPEGFQAGPTENPEDDGVDMDPDEDLPWPAPDLISNWWEKHKANFSNGKRYLLGKPITAEHLQYVLKYGRQRQRAAAALEIMILQPGNPLFEVRAPANQQMQSLGLRPA
jgi:uncharacterized protein (TIGR02270 family)